MKFYFIFKKSCIQHNCFFFGGCGQILAGVETDLCDYFRVTDLSHTCTYMHCIMHTEDRHCLEHCQVELLLSHSKCCTTTPLFESANPLDPEINMCLLFSQCAALSHFPQLIFYIVIELY